MHEKEYFVGIEWDANLIGKEIEGVLTKANEQGAWGIGEDLIVEFNKKVIGVAVK